MAMLDQPESEDDTSEKAFLKVADANTRGQEVV
eukprot:CAMPEP_0194525872 /NCGR_PEP_ID=MMETSP0253-20130528/61511_1 /TAXON_ID=2966 /ORGANISM="Noctiluca scintillans" /LENGTH=32 /DNA_ID= /DNA_START= /DNA_END= /DNA_ORIENTATION=